METTNSQRRYLHENPLAPSLDEFIQHHSDVRENEATNVKAEEFGGVAGGEFEADVCGGRVLEAWVFDLAGDLICSVSVSKASKVFFEGEGDGDGEGERDIWRRTQYLRCIKQARQATHIPRIRALEMYA
jgi:hypothetical protein